MRIKNEFILVRVDPVWLAVMCEAWQLAAAVILIVDRAGHIFEVLQVRPDNHVTQRYEVTVL